MHFETAPYFLMNTCLHASPFVIPLKDRAIPIYRAVYRRAQPNCHSEPVLKLAWESIRKSAFLRLPHQCAHWFAMTTKGSSSSINWNSDIGLTSGDIASQ